MTGEHMNRTSMATSVGGEEASRWNRGQGKGGGRDKRQIYEEM